MEKRYTPEEFVRDVLGIRGENMTEMTMRRVIVEAIEKWELTKSLELDSLAQPPRRNPYEAG